MDHDWIIGLKGSESVDAGEHYAVYSREPVGDVELLRMRVYVSCPAPAPWGGTVGMLVLAAPDQMDALLPDLIAVGASAEFFYRDPVLVPTREVAEFLGRIDAVIRRYFAPLPQGYCNVGQDADMLQK